MMGSMQPIRPLGAIDQTTTVSPMSMTLDTKDLAKMPSLSGDSRPPAYRRRREREKAMRAARVRSPR